MLFRCKRVWFWFLANFIVFDKTLVFVCNGYRLSDLYEVFLDKRRTFKWNWVVVPGEFICSVVDDLNGWSY